MLLANANELPFYDAGGVYLQTVGREGEGPGELQRLGWLRRYRGDFILTYDFNQVRISIWGTDGGFGRSYRLNPPGEVGFVLGADVFEDGTVLVKAPSVFRGGLSDGPIRRDEEYQTYSTEGELVDTVGLFRGPEQFVRTGGSGDKRFVAISTLPFGRRPVLAVCEDEFCIGAADSYEIQCHAQDGSPEILIRRNVPPRPVTDTDIASYVDRELAQLDDEVERRNRRESFGQMPTPETIPAYSDLKVDDGGNPWVREFDPEADLGRERTVFDSGGTCLVWYNFLRGFEPRISVMTSCWESGETNWMSSTFEFTN